MRLRRILIPSILSTLILFLSIFVTPTEAISSDIRQAWVGDLGVFPDAIRSGAGFSFSYDGRTSGPVFSADWQAVLADSGNIDQLRLAHHSGLVVTREARVLSGFAAIEYKLRFRNIGAETVPAVSGIKALDISFGAPVVDGSCVISSGGGLLDGFLPPRSFSVRQRCFSPITEYPDVVELTTKGGRSSSKDLPFFFVHNSAKQEGVFVALGWSGQWVASVYRDQQAGSLSIQGEIPDIEIALEPGEEIQGPTVLIGFYKGELADGSNRLRRLIRDVYTPALDGKKPLPRSTYDHYWAGIGLEFDESVLRKRADIATAIGQEYFLIDAGWYDGGWEVGNWYQIDKKKLPNGLRPVADYVHSRGLKLGLWFEPERVAEGSELAKAHPEWILWDYGSAAAPWLSFIPWIRPSDADGPPSKRYGLLNYGRPDVQEWVRTLLDYYIREYGLKYIRYDFNLEPLAYWSAQDVPGRRGVTQLKHIQGLYAILDWLLERHPEVIFEGCASGGHRIDLETARRFHTFWISDHTANPAIIRYHLFGINHFLPGNYHFVAYTLPLQKQEGFKPDDLGFQSLFGGSFGIGGRIDRWSDTMMNMARRHVDIHKKIRRYLVEDYYPLGSQPSDLKSWSGWQFHDPVDQSGFVQTFRTGTTKSTHRFVIRKLEEKARYRFSDMHGAESFEVAGSEAMTKGIEIRQAPMSSRVFKYTKMLECKTTHVSRIENACGAERGL